MTPSGRVRRLLHGRFTHSPPDSIRPNRYRLRNRIALSCVSTTGAVPPAGIIRYTRFSWSNGGLLRAKTCKKKCNRVCALEAVGYTVCGASLDAQAGRQAILKHEPGPSRRYSTVSCRVHSGAGCRSTQRNLRRRLALLESVSDNAARIQRPRPCSNHLID